MALHMTKTQLALADAGVLTAGVQQPRTEAKVIPIALSAPIPGLQDDESFLFILNQAMLFDLTASTDDIRSSHHVAATAILFNMALSLHHSGVRHHNAGNIEKACYLYDMCASKLAPGILSQVEQHAAVGLLVTMGSLSNQAQIQYMYQVRGSHEAATSLVIQMHELMMSTSVSFDSTIWASEQLCEMMLNAHMLLAVKDMPAAAA
ncbi:expressed unknown protein [Seminavis robusta]|uniref:Uncharacterized protein n=1 Tax=Seminavis robusta TaxID=568900 RepID=A0A9N8HY83_9STRA|nr:expressed unknown protein [Seminavis robusta]|eukprot:Sro2413_g326770.1 n/a (206) ;mRNA; f:9820-10437